MTDEAKVAKARATEIIRNHGVRIRGASQGRPVGLADTKRLLIELKIVHRFDPDLDFISSHLSV